MKKNIQYQFGASLFALAFSLGASLPAAAQTCVPPPSCDTLGFTKTAADCAGKTILKCPFDTTKVYCPGVEEQGDSPFVSTWEDGTSVLYNGKEIGTILEDRGASVVVVDKGFLGSYDYLKSLRSRCESQGRLLIYQWILPDQLLAQKIASKLNNRSNVFYDPNSNSGQDNDTIYYCYKSTSGVICASNYSRTEGYVYCVMTIPKPL